MQGTTITHARLLPRSGSESQYVVYVVILRDQPCKKCAQSFNFCLMVFFYRVLKGPLAYQADQACQPQRFV